MRLLHLSSSKATLLADIRTPGPDFQGSIYSTISWMSDEVCCWVVISTISPNVWMSGGWFFSLISLIGAVWFRYWFFAFSAAKPRPWNISSEMDWRPLVSAHDSSRPLRGSRHSECNFSSCESRVLAVLFRRRGFLPWKLYLFLHLMKPSLMNSSRLMRSFITSRFDRSDRFSAGLKFMKFLT